MKRQAILILCGDEYKRLPLLVDQFDERFNIYVHIDKKVSLPQTMRKLIKSKKSVKLLAQSYETNWGSMNIVNATLFLCRKALTDKCNTHFHLISGSDFPVATNEQIVESSQTSADNYMEYFPLPTPRWNDGGLSRLEYFHPLDCLDYWNPKERERYEKFLNVQKVMNIKRKLLDIPYYGGSTWWSLSRKCIEYVIRNLNVNNIYASMQNTYIPDEMFFQTTLLNSPLKRYIKNDNRRYIVWRVKNGHIPANLDMEDYDIIRNSNCLFMRKTDKNCSEKLVEMIIKQRNIAQ